MAGNVYQQYGIVVYTSPNRAARLYQQFGVLIFGEIPPDTTAPVISNIVATPGQTDCTVTWSTDEAADSAVDYGLTDSYGSTESSASLVTSHSVALSGLTAGTTYHYRVRSSDAATNEATSSDGTFITTSAGGILTFSDLAFNDLDMAE